MLGFSADGSGLRPNGSKLKVLGEYPTPKTEAKLDSFIHKTALDLQARQSQWDHLQDQEMLRGQHESLMAGRDERMEMVRQRFLSRFNRMETNRDSG